MESWLSYLNLIVVFFLGVAGSYISFRVGMRSERMAHQVGQNTITADKLNATMQVVLHCNERYSELYKLRHEADLAAPSAGVTSSLARTYFRQYWGLKSDQIDYWIAGYVDADTFLSWMIATANTLASDDSDTTHPNRVAGVSFEQSWSEMKEQHIYVNHTLYLVIEHFIDPYFKALPPFRKFVEMYKFLKEREDALSGIRKTIQDGRLNFSTLLEAYPKRHQDAILGKSRLTNDENYH